MREQLTEEDRALLDDLGEEAQRLDTPSLTQREEFVLAGFKEIQSFVDEHGRSPRHGEDGDIFERLYAMRLGRILESSECRGIVAALDFQGVLTETDHVHGRDQSMSDKELLEALGEGHEKFEIENLRYVRSSSERKAADMIANRQVCKEFVHFKKMFDSVQDDLDSGARETRPFETKSEIEQGKFFIVGGLKAYIAEKGDSFRTNHGVTDARLRVIFDNGTESNLLMRSLHRALNKDSVGRRITEANSGPLFSGNVGENDRETGTIYVLRSRSNHPDIVNNREFIHKIGVTSGDVRRRIAGANLQPTFLMASVEIVGTYRLYNIKRKNFEHLIHLIFSSARLDIVVKDRFGRSVTPKEWFTVPLHVIEKAISMIIEGTIQYYTYDPKSASLVIRNRNFKDS